MSLGMRTKWKWKNKNEKNAKNKKSKCLHKETCCSKIWRPIDGNAFMHFVCCRFFRKHRRLGAARNVGLCFSTLSDMTT